MTDIKLFTAADFVALGLPGSQPFEQWLADRANRLLLERSTRVYGVRDLSGECWTTAHHESRDTHQALLVGVEPLRRESAEDLVREMIAFIEERYPLRSEKEWIDRARKVLGAE